MSDVLYHPLETKLIDAVLANTVFYAGHCTGTPACEIMKEVLGSRLEPLQIGSLRLTSQLTGRDTVVSGEILPSWHARCDSHPPQEIWVGTSFLTQQEAGKELTASEHAQHNSGRVTPVLS